jgi:hypothetical protein
VAKRGKAAISSANQMNMEGILEGVIISELGSMEGIGSMVIMEKIIERMFT